MPGDRARTATSTNWRTANSRSCAAAGRGPSIIADRIASAASSASSDGLTSAMRIVGCRKSPGRTRTDSSAFRSAAQSASASWSMARR